MSCGVGHRHGSDLVWLLLWHRPTAVALIQPLAWELPYATECSPKKQKNKKQKTNADPQAPPQTCLNRICILIKSQVIYGHIRA